MRRWCTGLVFGAVFGASVATAQPTIGDDIVVLPGNGRLRGTVTVYEPGERLVITLPDGTVRELTADEIVEVRFGDQPAAPPPEPAAPLPERMPPAPDPPAPEPVAALADPSSARPAAWTEPRVFGPPARHDAPWDSGAHRETWRDPHGLVHVGLQAGAGVRLIQSTLGDIASPVFEVALLLDVVLARIITLRLAALLDGSPEIASGTSAGVQLESRTLAWGARALLGIDLVEELVFRFGGAALGVRVGEQLAFELVGRLELALRLLEARQLEVGLAVSGGFTTLRQTGFVAGIGRVDTGTRVSTLFPDIAAMAAWVFP